MKSKNVLRLAIFTSWNIYCNIHFEVHRHVNKNAYFFWDREVYIEMSFKHYGKCDPNGVHQASNTTFTEIQLLIIGF